MKILVSTMPASGHVMPFINTVKQLVADGHRVLWHSGERQRARIEATGATFVPFDQTPDIEKTAVEAQKYSGLKAANKAMEALFIEPMKGQVADYQKIDADFHADLLLVDMCGLGAHAYHELGGPVYASVGINPYRTDISPVFGSGKSFPTNGLARFNNRFINYLSNHFVLKEANDVYNTKRRELGLQSMPTGRTMFDDVNSPYLFLHGTTPDFEYPYQNLPDTFHFVGPMLAPQPDHFDAPTWWQDIEKATVPVIHVTQGTVATDVNDLIVPTIKAVTGRSVLLVVTTPNPEQLPDLPANVRVAPFIPHAQLLPLTNIMITNAGYNGAKEALANGVPMIAAGTSEDKAEVSARIAYCGVGLNLQTTTPTPQQLAAAIDTLMTDKSYQQKALTVRTSFKQYNSPMMIESLLDQLIKH